MHASQRARDKEGESQKERAGEREIQPESHREPQRATESDRENHREPLLSPDLLTKPLLGSQGACLALALNLGLAIISTELATLLFSD